MKEAAVHEKPASPANEDDNATSKDDGMSRGSYALADMDKATFDEVRVVTVRSRRVRALCKDLAKTESVR